MVFLKSDIFFNPIFTPGFSGSGSRVQGPGSRVQGPGPGFRSSPYFEKYQQTAASENLSCAAILNFRRYLRRNSLSAFYRIGVLKTSAKFLGNHIYWSLFSIKLQTFSLKFYYMKDCITDIF